MSETPNPSNPFEWLSSIRIFSFPRHGVWQRDGEDGTLRISIFIVPRQGNDGGTNGTSLSFEELLNRSLQQVRHRNNPVSPIALSKLATIPIKSTKRFPDPCTVCQELLKEGDTATKLPCSHTYHKDCIAPWFESHNSCPVCRYELPVEDPEKERERKERMSDRDELFANKPKCCGLLDFTECIHAEEPENNSTLEPLSACGHLYHHECIQKWCKHDKESTGSRVCCPNCHVISLPIFKPKIMTTRSQTLKRRREELHEEEKERENLSPKKKQKTE